MVVAAGVSLAWGLPGSAVAAPPPAGTEPPPAEQPAFAPTSTGEGPATAPPSTAAAGTTPPSTGPPSTAPPAAIDWPALVGQSVVIETSTGETVSGTVAADQGTLVSINTFSGLRLLQKAQVVSAVSNAPSSTSQAPAPVPGPAGSPTGPDPALVQAKKLRIAGAVVLATGVGLGAVIGLLGAARARTASEDLSGTTPGSSRQDAFDRGRTGNAMAISGLVLMGLGGVGGGVLLGLSAKKRKEARPVQAGVSLTPTASTGDDTRAGLSLTGKF